MTTKRLALLGLLGLLLAVPATVSDAGGVRLYDARASLACLKKRPAFRPAGAVAQGGELAFQVLDARHLEYDPLDGLKTPINAYGILLSWSGDLLLKPSFGGGILNTDERFFTSEAAVAASYQRGLARISRTPPIARTSWRSTNQIYGNVLINWFVPTPPKQVRSIILGCLRTKAATTPPPPTPTGRPETVVLRPAAPPGQAITRRELDGLTSVLEARLHNLGIAGSVTQPAGTSAVVITINRAPLPAATLRALIEPGELGMYDLEGDLMSPSIDKNGNPVPHRDKLKLGAKTTLVTCGGPGTHALLCPGGADPTVKNYYLLKRDPGHHVPQLTAADLNPRASSRTSTQSVSRSSGSSSPAKAIASSSG